MPFQMKNDKLPMLFPVPKVGSDVLKLKDGKIVKWRDFDEKTQMFDIELPNGEVSKIHQRDVEMPV